MKKINRVLAVCNDLETCDIVLAKAAEIVKAQESGLTVMFVVEEALFDLPFYTAEDILDSEKIRHELLEKTRAAGVENAAIFVRENDTADRVALEAEREDDSLIVTYYTQEISADIAQKCKTPLLVLKNRSHIYTSAVVTVDTVPSDKCLSYVRTVFDGLSLSLYQDFQYIPMTSVDPVIEPYDISVDTTLFQELMEARRDAFETFCREKGLEGTFEVGENGIAEDTAAFTGKKKADLLVIAALDRDTMLGDAVEDILDQAPVDTLICFDN